MKKILLFVVIFSVFGCTSGPQKVANSTKYEENWESLKTHETPDWFLDAKFGIYCHWGPYSVPAFETEWYSHWMYVNENNPEWPGGKKIHEHHVNTYGPLDKFGYKDFIPMFTAEKFNAEEWAELFKQSGARFAGPVTEHADGFAMWDSKVTKWNAAQMGPKRDIVGELAKAIRDRDMKFIATFHHHWKYAWYPTWDETTDCANPEYEDLYGPKVKRGDFVYPNNPHRPDTGEKYYPLPEKKFSDEWEAKILEVIDNYEPDLVYFDNKMDIIDEANRLHFLSYYYNFADARNQDVVVTYKFHDLAEGSAVYDLERARMSEMKPFPWLTDDSVDWGSWCDVSEPDYKSTNRLIDFLLDVISKNGCVLLNITPKANGEIPQPVKDRLLEMGAWLRMNGEAVYETRPWKIFGEGPAEVIEGHLSERQNADNTAEDIRFTQKGNALYAFVLDWPEGDVNIRALGTNAGLLDKEIQSVEMLGSEETIRWEMTGEAMKISFPSEKPCDFAHVLKINLK